MNIPFSGTYTPDQLERFERAARKALGSSGINAKAGCFGIAAAILLVLGVTQWTAGNQSGAIQWLALFLIAAVLAPVQWWSTKRAFARHPNRNQEISGAIKDEGLDIRTSTSQSTIKWEGISSSFATDNFLILIATAGVVHGVSADFFHSSEEFASACEFVAKHVAGRPPAQTARKRLFKILGWVVFVVFVLLVWSLLRPGA